MGCRHFRGRGGFRHRRGTQELPALHEDRHSRRPVPAPERHRTARTFRHGIYRRQGGGSVLLSGRLWRFPFLCTTTHTGTEKDRQKAHGRNIYDRLEQFFAFPGRTGPAVRGSGLQPDGGIRDLSERHQCLPELLLFLHAQPARHL